MRSLFLFLFEKHQILIWISYFKQISLLDYITRKFLKFISCELYFQDTLKSSPPENKVMKKANKIAISTMTVFFLMCGCLGYAAFGNKARGNMLTGFGFYEPFWLIDLGNIMIVVHLLGSYQVLSFKHSKSMLNFYFIFLDNI